MTPPQTSDLEPVDPESFQKTRRGDHRIRHAPETSPASVLEVLENHRRRVERGSGDCLKVGPVTSVSRGRLAMESRSVEVAVKRFAWRGLRRSLSELLFGSRARRALEGARRAAPLVRTPRPLAIAERRRLGLVRESFLITRYVRGARSLRDALRDLVCRPGRCRSLASALGDTVGRLHAGGVDHPDLKDRNILVGPGRRLHVLDLDALLPERRLTWRRRVRGIGVLAAYVQRHNPWVSRPDRLRFVEAYLARQPELASRRRRLVREVRASMASNLHRWSCKDRDRGRRIPPDDWLDPHGALRGPVQETT